MFPQARLVSLQLDQEAGKRNQLPAKEAPLTFGSFYVQELLGGDNDERCDDNNDNDDNYNYICNYGQDFEILRLGFSSCGSILFKQDFSCPIHPTCLQVKKCDKLYANQIKEQCYFLVYLVFCVLYVQYFFKLGFSASQ